MTTSSETTRPRLGSALLTAESRLADKAPRRLLSQCREIDAALDGGLFYSDLVTIAAAVAKVRSLLAIHFIASHLVEYDTDVVVIDTNGAFDVEVLRDVIAMKIAKTNAPMLPVHEGYMYQPVTNEDETSSSDTERAASYLDRVKLARVFDATGLLEMLSEVRSSCQSSRKTSYRDTESVLSGTLAPGGTFARDHSDADGIAVEELSRRATVGVLVIDDLASLLSPLMSADYTEGQAYLSSIHRSLRHLADTYEVCTIMLNSVTDTSKAPGLPSTKTVSVFQSVRGRPGLGQTLNALVDKSILLARLPKSRRDAELVYGGGTRDQGPTGEYIETLEILKDRSGRAQDRIAAFEVLQGRRIEGYPGCFNVLRVAK